MAHKKSSGLAYMSKSKRKSISKKKPALMGLPSEGKYPLSEDGKTPSRKRAVAAKQRAGQQKSMGNLSAAEKRTIDRKADKIIGKSAKKMTKRKNSKDTTAAEDKKLSEYMSRGRR